MGARELVFKFIDFAVREICHVIATRTYLDMDTEMDIVQKTNISI